MVMIKISKMIVIVVRLRNIAVENDKTKNNELDNCNYDMTIHNSIFKTRTITMKNNHNKE